MGRERNNFLFFSFIFFSKNKTRNKKTRNKIQEKLRNAYSDIDDRIEGVV